MPEASSKDFLRLLIKEHEITVNEAADALIVGSEKILKWSLYLQEKGYVKLDSSDYINPKITVTRNLIEKTRKKGGQKSKTDFNQELRGVLSVLFVVYVLVEVLIFVIPEWRAQKNSPVGNALINFLSDEYVIISYILLVSFISFYVGWKIVRLGGSFKDMKPVIFIFALAKAAFSVVFAVILTGHIYFFTNDLYRAGMAAVIVIIGLPLLGLIFGFVQLTFLLAWDIIAAYVGGKFAES